MLHLRHVRALDVAQRWVWLHQVVVDEVFKRHQVPGLAEVVKPSAAEREGAEVLLDAVQERLRTLHAQRGVRGVEDLHVVRALQVLHDVALATGCEGLDSVKLTLLHLLALGTLHDGDRFSAVDLVRPDGVPVEISHGLDRQGLAVQLDLVRLDGLLDVTPDLAHPGVDAGGLDACVGARLGRLDDGVVLGVEGHCEGAVHNAPADLHAEVQLADVIVLQHRVVAVVRSPMRSDPVQRATCGEAPAALQAVGRDELVGLLL
mmetsp:Transcript_83405/g.220105  ORF Transcript_83405/g.220105 Transcript_83405/m.220105 type:complete len:261 (-) Transcript_83405:1411-2193(-)